MCDLLRLNPSAVSLQSRSGMLDSSYTSTASINVMNGQATLSDIAEDKQSESDVTQAAALIKETVVVTDPTSTGMFNAIQFISFPAHVTVYSNVDGHLCWKGGGSPSPNIWYVIIIIIDIAMLMPMAFVIDMDVA